MEIRSETPTDEIISESDRRSMVGIPEEEGATSGGGSGALGNLSVGVPPSGRSTEADAASSRVSTLPGRAWPRLWARGFRPRVEAKLVCPLLLRRRRTSAAPRRPHHPQRARRSPSPPGRSMQGHEEALSRRQTRPRQQARRSPLGKVCKAARSSVETPAGTSGGGRSSLRQGGPSTEATENLTPRKRPRRRL